jgi:hypothetical protein
VSTILLGADGRPAKVADGIIDALKAREDAGGFITLPKQQVRPEFEKGDRIKVIRGPLQALDGLYEGQSNGARVLILMSLFGGERIVDLARGDIKRAETIS